MYWFSMLIANTAIYPHHPGIHNPSRWPCTQKAKSSIILADLCNYENEVICKKREYS